MPAWPRTVNFAALTEPEARAASPVPLTVTLLLTASRVTVLAPALAGLMTAPKSRP